MFKAIGLAALTVAALSSTAYAGCLGAGLGDGCIGIPTPREHREVYEGDRYRHDPVIVEHHTLQARLAVCRLELHPTKTKIVYCKDGRRKEKYPNVKFDFLGYGFRPRWVKNSRSSRPLI